jgi:hypothetical protein
VKEVPQTHERPATPPAQERDRSADKQDHGADKQDKRPDRQ